MGRVGKPAYDHEGKEYPSTADMCRAWKIPEEVTPQPITTATAMYRRLLCAGIIKYHRCFTQSGDRAAGASKERSQNAPKR